MSEIARTSNLINLGDTSFRRRNTAESYVALLEVLGKYRKKDVAWNTESQTDIYHHFREEASIAYNSSSESANDLTPETQAQRARTNVNPLSKLGFVHQDKTLTPLGEALVDNNEQILDNFDINNHLSVANSAFFRGIFRYKVNLTDNSWYYPARLLIKEIVKHQKLSIEQFIWIFMLGPYLVGPNSELFSSTIQNIGDGERLDNIVYNYIGNTLKKDDQSELENFIETGNFPHNFFKNRKTNKGLSKLEQFINALTQFKLNPTEESLKNLRSINAEKTIKSAFNLKLPKENSGISASEVHQGINIPEFHNEKIKSFRKGIALWHKTIKLLTLSQKEYFDLNRRTLRATGVFTFENNIVKFRSLYSQVFFEANIDRLEGSEFYLSDPGEIVGLEYELGSNCYTRAEKLFAKRFNIDPTDAEEYARTLDLEKFNEIVTELFPTETVWNLLRTIQNSYPEEQKKLSCIRKKFDDRASIPTIYEYLLGLGLYYASEKSFDILAAYGLALGGDFLPETHAPGMRGDIEFKYGNQHILIEATLMDSSTQRRGELEPVLRHATNYEVEFPGALTLFVANQLDQNVQRIFGFASLMQLYPTLRQLKRDEIKTAAPRIFSLTTNNFVDILSSGRISLEKLIHSVDTEMKNMTVETLNTDWQEKLTKQLAATISNL